VLAPVFEWAINSFLLCAVRMRRRDASVSYASDSTTVPREMFRPLRIWENKQLTDEAHSTDEDSGMI
jgi:hypothetical protein